MFDVKTSECLLNVNEIAFHFFLSNNFDFSFQFAGMLKKQIAIPDSLDFIWLVEKVSKIIQGYQGFTQKLSAMGKTKK
jgi:hypothetical protein